MNKVYISKNEYEKCKHVKTIFDELAQNQTGLNAFCIADAYPFGFVVLEWFYEDEGFEDKTYFNESSKLFDHLFGIWEYGYNETLKEKYGNWDMSDEQLEELISDEDRAIRDKKRQDCIAQYKKGIAKIDEE